MSVQSSLGYNQYPVPVGTVSYFAGSVAPATYLVCQGQSVAISEFPELYQVLGTGYTSVPDGTHFNLPDMITYPYLRGFDVLTQPFNHAPQAGTLNGNVSVTLAANNIPSINGANMAIAVTGYATIDRGAAPIYDGVDPLVGTLDIVPASAPITGYNYTTISSNSTTFQGPGDYLSVVGDALNSDATTQTHISIGNAVPAPVVFTGVAGVPSLGLLPCIKASYN